MKILFYSAKDFEKPYFLSVNKKKDELVYLSEALSLSYASKSIGYEAISIFINDDASAKVLERLFKNGVRIIATRAAGYDNIDIDKANELGITVTNVPDYSPYAIAEHALALLLALNRKIIVADRQVHKQDFTIGKLIGFDLHGKTVGVIGVGKIGSIFIKIMHGFGCRLLGYDIQKSKTLVKKYGLKYVSIEELCRESNIISMHTPLTKQTRYLIGEKLISLMKDGVTLINTSRGLCVNTVDVLDGLKKGKIGYFGADVYEGEKGIFFFDHSHLQMQDTTLDKLLELNNVIITPHQAFATTEALTGIARSVYKCIRCYIEKKFIPHQLTNIPMTTIVA